MNRKVLRLAIPSILANITVPLVGMVDLAIAGHIGDAASIGGIAVATMLFDLLYWNMGFLRVGTGGYAAQSYGKRDFKGAFRVLVQAMATALFAALVLLAIQFFFLEAAFWIIDTTPQTEELARKYFFIRIWGAPATLALFVFRGWFIGMQNTVSPMVIDVSVNVLNAGLSILFTIYMGMGIAGIAAGTLVSQYVGLIIAVTLMLIYYRKLFHYIQIKGNIKLSQMKSFFATNGNLFIRSSALLLIYSGFTSIAANYGDNLLAVSTIMMKLMLLFSYFVDGFAYAGEALTGRYIGAKEIKLLKHSIKVIFGWAIVIAAFFTIGYLFASESVFRLMTNNTEVITAARDYMPWLLFVPLFSCIAFVLDGIFIGATASAAIRDTMIFSAIAFFAFYYILEPKIGLQALYAGYMAHLLVRTIVMSLFIKKKVFARAV